GPSWDPSHVIPRSVANSEDTAAPRCGIGAQKTTCALSAWNFGMSRLKELECQASDPDLGSEALMPSLV
ncbi:hypothetical protein STEG23_015902, partial [Scotinomys teguina]